MVDIYAIDSSNSMVDTYAIDSSSSLAIYSGYYTLGKRECPYHMMVVEYNIQADTDTQGAKLTPDNSLRESCNK